MLLPSGFFFFFSFLPLLLVLGRTVVGAGLKLPRPVVGNNTTGSNFGHCFLLIRYMHR